VLLLRQQDTDVEVLMVRRHANLQFMGGMWVFPGGSLSAHDCEPAAVARLIQSPEGKRAKLTDVHLKPLADTIINGLLVAACRETFEETGVLLAQHADGRWCDPELLARLQPERTAIDRDAAAFTHLLAREQLFLNADRLVYWSHWITPSAAGPKRFDTRFFAFAVPSHHAVSTLSTESTEAAWMTPTAVLAAAERGEMAVPGPTSSNLQDIQCAHEKYGSVTAMLEQERLRLVLPIMPKILRVENRTSILMPWDPEYSNAPGEGIDPSIEFPQDARRPPARQP
jgi:8-oxo-dGTP pyrophosphatase MutT (NUDIX family)